MKLAAFVIATASAQWWRPNVGSTTTATTTTTTTTPKPTTAKDATTPKLTTNTTTKPTVVPEQTTIDDSTTHIHITTDTQQSSKNFQSTSAAAPVTTAKSGTSETTTSWMPTRDTTPRTTKPTGSTTPWTQTPTKPTGRTTPLTPTPTGSTPRTRTTPTQQEDRSDGSCRRMRDDVVDSGIVGAWVPECDDHGFFTTKQCNYSARTCWCVKVNGEMVDGTSDFFPDPSKMSAKKCARDHDDRHEESDKDDDEWHNQDGLPWLLY